MQFDFCKVITLFFFALVCLLFLFLTEYNDFNSYNLGPSQEISLNHGDSSLRGVSTETPVHETPVNETLVNETLENETLENETLENETLENDLKTLWGISKNDELHFLIVADLDRSSRLDDTYTTKWHSFLKEGILRRNSSTSTWTIDWLEPDKELIGHIGEDGRGMELSELISWNNMLLTFDDRSGVVFEVNAARECVPKYILMEGDGNSTKGQKTEWATVKDGDLYAGSFGKPYTNADGEITSNNTLWVKKLSMDGMIEHMDWKSKYELMQEVTDSKFPGYMIHEAIHWDEINRQWYVLPRRVSKNKYDEKLDEKMGSNLVLVFDENWEKMLKNFTIGERIPEHGWSSLKFVPGTNNELILALRSMEIEDKSTSESIQETYITAFNVDGTVIIPEERIPTSYKFEGIEFI